jgi:2-oxoglutarate ferredoxin oxidoreductase subunit alpha
VAVPDTSSVQLVDRLRYATNGNGHAGPGIESGYRRYQITESGVSPMAIPGTEGGQYVSTGLEHNEAGRPRSDGANHRQMTEKRFKKMEHARQAAPPPDVYGDEDAEIGILCWGSTWGTVVEAIDIARRKGLKVAALAPRMLWPLPDQQIRPFLESKRRVLVPETNYSGQLAQLVRARYLHDVQSVTEFSGAAFTVARMVQEIEGVHQHA